MSDKNRNGGTAPSKGRDTDKETHGKNYRPEEKNGKPESDGQ